MKSNNKGNYWIVFYVILGLVLAVLLGLLIYFLVKKQSKHTSTSTSTSTPTSTPTHSGTPTGTPSILSLASKSSLDKPSMTFNQTDKQKQLNSILREQVKNWGDDFNSMPEDKKNKIRRCYQYPEECSF